jgi:large subunit ribosomal protein L13
MTKTTLASTARSTAKWYLVDASTEVLGRMAARVAQILMGKHKPVYTPHADTGDFVVVINAADVQVTGRKAEDKLYRHHTRYPGGLVTIPYPELKQRHPTAMVREAVRRMLPKNTMGRHMLSKLKVFPGKDHDHHAQKPEPLAFGTGA